MSRVYRYVIVLDRYPAEDFGPEQGESEGDYGDLHDGSELAACQQVAEELQEALEVSGALVGQFEVVARFEADR